MYVLLYRWHYKDATVGHWHEFANAEDGPISEYIANRLTTNPELDHADFASAQIIVGDSYAVSR